MPAQRDNPRDLMHRVEPTLNLDFDEKLARKFQGAALDTIKYDRKDYKYPWFDDSQECLE